MPAETWVACLVAISLLLSAGAPAEAGDADPRLRAGFQAMYALDFAGCEREFKEYVGTQPDDPLGYASQAACVLFAELYRLGALDAELYLDDKDLFKPPRVEPDPRAKLRLFELTARGREQAEARLQREPGGEEALFGLALVNGLEADYIFMVEKRGLRAAKSGRAAYDFAKQLIQVNPSFYDAYIWTGVMNYVVSSLPFPVRWLAKLRGYSGNKRAARRDLTITAEHGSLLRPYANILLAVIALREKDRASAASLLAGLSSEFPTNDLFAKHAQRLAAR